MGSRYRQIFFQKRVQNVLIGLGGMGHIRHDDRADFEGMDHIVQTADMVLMGMGSDQIIQFCYVQGAEVFGNNASALIGSRIHQHGLFSRLDQDGISLPHIDEMNPEIPFRRAIRYNIGRVGGRGLRFFIPGAACAFCSIACCRRRIRLRLCESSSRIGTAGKHGGRKKECREKKQSG